MDGRVYSLVCASAVRVFAVPARGLEMVCGHVLYFARRGVTSMFILEFASHVLRGCAYGMGFSMCYPSGAPLYVFVCTAVGMCSLDGVPIAPEYVCVCTCTVFGMYSPSDVPVLQDMCVCLHSTRRVQPERYTYCA